MRWGDVLRMLIVDRLSFIMHGRGVYPEVEVDTPNIGRAMANGGVEAE